VCVRQSYQIFAAVGTDSTFVDGNYSILPDYGIDSVAQCQLVPDRFGGDTGGGAAGGSDGGE